MRPSNPACCSAQLNRMLAAELQRGLKQQGVVVKTWQQFADRAVLKKRGSHFPWWTCLMTYTLCIIFFFMAGEPLAAASLDL